MGKEFVIGDLHFGSDDIRIFEQRPWKNVEEMNKGLIFNWMKTVSKDDTVFVLGDFLALDKMTEELEADIKAFLNDRTIKQVDLMQKHNISRNTLKKYIEIVKEQV